MASLAAKTTNLFSLSDDAGVEEHMFLPAGFLFSLSEHEMDRLVCRTRLFKATDFSCLGEVTDFLFLTASISSREMFN